MLELQPVRQIRTVELRRPRIRTFDGARGFALLLAIVAHAMTLFPSGLGPYEQDVVAVIVMTTKAAPPLFVFVFGLTMAYVYSEQVMTPEGFAHVRRRLWTRALFAFLSFELIVLVVETANGSTLHVIFERMTYRRPGSWAEVLNYYAVVLLTAPWFLRLWQNAPMSYRILSIPVLYVAGVLLSHVAVPGSLFVLKNIITSYPLSEVSTVRLDSFPVLQFSAFCLVGLLLGGCFTGIPLLREEAGSSGLPACRVSSVSS